MKFCTNCGTKLNDEVKFCTECGQKVPQTVTPPPVSEPVAVPIPEPVNPPPVYVADPVPGKPEFPLQPQVPAEIINPPVLPYKPLKPAKEKKRRLGLKIALIALLVVGIVIGLFACIGSFGGSDDPNLGRYDGVTYTYLDMEFDASEEWIELKSGGRMTITLVGEEYSGKWKLDGQALIVTQAGDEFRGTLKDGVITLDLKGLVYTYVKEGSGATVQPGGQNQETTPPAVSEVGYWALKYSEGESDYAMDEQTIQAMKDQGMEFYVELNADGTGVFVLDDSMTITWGDGKLVASDGSEVPYRLENGELIVELEGATMHYIPGQKNTVSGGTVTEEPVSYKAVSGVVNGVEMNDTTLAQMGDVIIVFNGDGTGTMNYFGQETKITYDATTITRHGNPMSYTVEGEKMTLQMSDTTQFVLMTEAGIAASLTPDDLQYYAGDWYGWWCFGDVIEGDPDLEGSWWDCCMSLDIQEDGSGTITIWDQDYGKDDPIALVEVTVTVTNGVALIISESGQFMDCPVGYADWYFYSDEGMYDNTLGFWAMYEDEEYQIDCYFLIRPWGMLWDDVAAVDPHNVPGLYEDWYLPLIGSGVTKAPETVG